MKSKLALTLIPMLTLFLAIGCSQEANESSKSPEASTAENSEVKKHTHEGWWCDEHGIPEEKCGMCNSKLAAEFQKKGDWCKEHDRPDSQCFVCHPELEVKFASLFEAKYGKKPPKPTE